MSSAVLGHLPCLPSHQAQPVGPGVDETINCVSATGNGPGTGNVTGCCAVCSLEKPCLFAVKIDPHETSNVAAKYPAVVSQLGALLHAAVPYGNMVGDYDSWSETKELLWPQSPADLSCATRLPLFSPSLLLTIIRVDRKNYDEVCPVTGEQSKACDHWRNFSGTVASGLLAFSWLNKKLLRRPVLPPKG